MKRKANNKQNKSSYSLFCQGIKKAMGFLIRAIFLITLIAVFLILSINGYILLRINTHVLDEETLEVEAKKGAFDYIIVLGAGVRPNGEPSPMLKERIDKGMEAYWILGNTPLLMSGDSVDRYYKETVVMVEKAVEQGVPKADIIEDKYGISTYDSIWRLKNLFRGKKVLIVTQNYHLSRSIYLAQSFGMDAYGYDAQKVRYRGQFYRDLREIMARVKDFGLGFLKPAARYTQKDK